MQEFAVCLMGSLHTNVKDIWIELVLTLQPSSCRGWKLLVGILAGCSVLSTSNACDCQFRQIASMKT